MQFALTIDLGNEAMQTPQDVADALRKIATQLDEDASGAPDGLIRDLNGNTVGEYSTYDDDPRLGEDVGEAPRPIDLDPHRGG